jgi:hypothetical protein
MTPTPDEARLRARQQLATLLEVLRAQPDTAAIQPLVTLCDDLDRAIASFHLEAIRFRMFTLGRTLQAAPVPPEAATLYDAVRASLEAAGFQTRSMT